jgi:hypothetical protein
MRHHVTASAVRVRMPTKALPQGAPIVSNACPADACRPVQRALLHAWPSAGVTRRMLSTLAPVRVALPALCSSSGHILKMDVQQQCREYMFRWKVASTAIAISNKLTIYAPHVKHCTLHRCVHICAPAQWRTATASDTSSLADAMACAGLTFDGLAFTLPSQKSPPPSAEGVHV